MKILAHDLRTPISGIKILAESLLDSAQLNQNLNRIISNCNVSLNLMEDLLSYIQTDSVKINLTQIIVEDYINSVVESFSFMLSEKNITLDVSNSKTNLILTLCDLIKYLQILFLMRLNLVIKMDVFLFLLRLRE